MVTFNLAYTSPINKDGVTPVLKQHQVWRGLELKVRRAQDFVSAIVKCEVLEENTLPDGTLVIKRRVRFAADSTRKWVNETCVHYKPCRVVFQQEDGSTITNVISKDPDGELMMSYVFEWRHPDMDEGSEEAAQLEEKHLEMAKLAVESSIDIIRLRVTEGRVA
ncbi:hypothetical protein F4777DRAFT_596731 [Nemania sp. FL0916]|nr:hypothetical protein F4777DRAFT_596731 [Nemania sp. FL0916]